MVPYQEEVVILVHGTFAGDESDDGEKWWQKNSATWKSIASRLPENVRIDQTFHWADGPNSMRGRTAAAYDLLERLESLEREGRGYHLVGHSHGGSVIWEALRLSTIRRLKISRRHGKGKYATRRKAIDLVNLRSWITVGTPFLELSPGKGWNLGLFGKIGHGLEILLDKVPFLSYLLALATYAIAVFTLLGVIIGGLGFWLFPDETPGFFSLPEDATYADLLSAYLIWSLILISAVPFILSQTERWQLFREIDASKRTFVAFGDKWLGLVCRHDEALAALAASKDLDLHIIPKRSVAEEVFYSDQLFSWTRPWRKAFNVLANLMNKPLNRFVSSALKSRAHGNDRPGAIVSRVAPLPIADTFEGIYLPHSVDAEIVELANSRAQVYIPEARHFIGEFATTGYQIRQLGHAANELEDISSCLVHNSYFDSRSLVDLILWQISQACKCCVESGVTRIDSQLAAWAVQQKLYIEQQIGKFT